MVKLSGRLTIAITALALFSAAAVGGLSYWSVRQTLLPRALDRFDLQTALVAAKLESMLTSVRPAIMSERSGMDLTALGKAVLDSGDWNISGETLTDLRSRITSRFIAQLNANPNFVQLRVIGVGDSGRELVRVDRESAGAPVNVVPPEALQRKGDRPYFTDSLRLKDGEVHVSPIELNQEQGRIQEPHLPVLRVSTLIHVDGKPFGVLILNIDMRPVLDVVRNSRASGRMMLVNAEGDYLAHPDPSREFGFELGLRRRLQDDFPGIGDMQLDDMPPGIHSDRHGASFGIGSTVADFAGGLRVGVVQIVPTEEVFAAIAPMRNSIALAGLGAGLGGAALAALIARSLTRPLERITEALGTFSPDKPVTVSVDTGGELGLLARQFNLMAREVTARSAEIRRQAEIFDLIMSRMSDMVMLFDEDRRLVYANPVALQSLDIAEHIGAEGWKDAFDVLSGNDGATPVAFEDRPIIRAIAGERVDTPDMIYRRKDGTRMNVDISGRPISDDEGNPRGAVMVVRDITRAKDAEQQLRQNQRLEAIGHLTGGVAHDFNNLLTVILGTSELLIDAAGDRTKVARMAETVIAAAERGAQLTSQLLSFARKQALQPARTDVNAIVDEVTQLLRPTLGENVEIELVLEKAAWPSMIDPSQLSTALLNLAVNARDAMPEGGKLTLETDNVILDAAYASGHSEVKPGDYVMVAVSDTGAGIPEEIKDRVFEPFFTTKDEGKGTGLGLAMVYGFVKQSGGHIKIYSEVGHGTTVKLYLPRSIDSNENDMPVPTLPTPQGFETILLVEDDAMVRAHAVAVLTSLGYRIVEASNGMEALALFNSGTTFDLLFTDVIMPGGMNGRQLADALAPRVENFKVLYASGYTENAIVHHGRLDPGVDLIAKPYRRADLARKLREVLARPGTPSPEAGQAPSLPLT